jgi:hypothetical protein
LRANEVISLKIGGIDSTRIVIRDGQSKGHKDRYVDAVRAIASRLKLTRDERAAIAAPAFLSNAGERQAAANAHPTATSRKATRRGHA